MVFQYKYKKNKLLPRSHFISVYDMLFLSGARASSNRIMMNDDDDDNDEEVDEDEDNEVDEDEDYDEDDDDRR
jgi:hypothetical protein